MDYFFYFLNIIVIDYLHKAFDKNTIIGGKYMRYTKQEYLELSKKLQHYSDCYYTKFTSEISDQEYDELFDKVKDILKVHPEWKTDSPVTSVGTNDFSGRKKNKHIVRMYSLDKIYTPADLNKYYKRFSELRSKDGKLVDTYYLDYKLDGVSLELVYINGKLTTATTRGDGKCGIDVTNQALNIVNIPHFICTRGTMVIHGEVVVHKYDFYNFNRTHNTKISTPRHYAASSLITLDPEVIKERALKFYGWGCFPPLSSSLPRNIQIEHLNKFGFNTPVGKICSNVTEMMSFINETARIRNTLPYEIDGVVIKQNEDKYQKKLGWNEHAPLWAVAWKFTSNGAITNITDITWNVGRTGKLTPVASITPVMVNGVTISKCSLSNADIVQKNEAGKGSSVRVILAGDVIPKINTYITASKDVFIPEKCPVCDTVLERVRNDLYCPNRDCKGRLISLLTYIAGKDVLNIHWLGADTVKEMVSSGIIQAFTDLFTPMVSKSKKVSQELLDRLVKRMQSLNMMELLMILGIPHMGRALAVKLAAEVLNIDGLINLFTNRIRFESVYISDMMKETLKKWYADEYNQKLLLKLKSLPLRCCK